MRLALPRPRYADVAATLALVVALSGTAYAVTALPRNSVDTRSIQHGAVTNPKIAANAIQSTRIKNGTLTGADVADGSVRKADLAPNSVTGKKVAANSIGVGDLVGADVSGAISFSLGANSCGTLSLGVGGAAVGEAVIMSYTGDVALPPGVVFGPLRVVSAGQVSTRACNVTGTSVSVAGIGVRIVTFG
jgi:hypothetical protein